MLKSVVLKDLLSFGPEPATIPLLPLNVIIGANGTGKSNLVEAISLLRAAPRDLPLPVRLGGGVNDWLWRDGIQDAKSAQIEAIVVQGRVTRDDAVRYQLEFGAEGDRFVVLNERIEREMGQPKPFLYFGYDNGRPMLSVTGQRPRELRREDIDPAQSILSQRRDPDSYPEITALADLLRDILIYRSWHFGPDAAVRRACAPGVRTDRLSESFDNLPARLSALKRNPDVKHTLRTLLADLSPGFDDVDIVLEGGALQLYLTEGRRVVPAHRLSDGTLRYLCLLAILLDPQPPPLIVLEEPELGIHPDLLPTLRDLLVSASARTQLIVTTHSSQLLDALTDHANSVLVCEKDQGGTSMVRLRQEDVDTRSAVGGLGHQWLMGMVGGTRW